MQLHQISFWTGNSYDLLLQEDPKNQASCFDYTGPFGTIRVKQSEGKSAQFYFYSFKINQQVRIRFYIPPGSICIMVSEQGAFIHIWGEQSRCLAKSLGDIFYNPENFFTLQFLNPGTYALNLVQLSSSILEAHRSLNAPIQMLMVKAENRQAICLNELPFVFDLEDRIVLEEIRYRGQQPSKVLVSTQCLLVFIRIVEKLIRHGFELTNSSVPGYDMENLEKAAVEIMAMPFQKISIPDLAKRNGLSPNRFKYLFKQQFGMTVHRFILKLRVENANGLIAHTGLSIREIATQIGYASDATFSALFKKKTGSTPMELRKKIGRKITRPGSELTR